MTTRVAWASLAALCVAGAATAQLVVIDAKPLPLTPTDGYATEAKFAQQDRKSVV